VVVERLSGRGLAPDRNPLPNRGYALTIDSGWRGVADTALGFIKRFV
jgi:hypothetical protein